MTLDVVAVHGEKRLQIGARISAPERQADGSWLCRVEIAPLENQALNVRGVDAFHAMWLACSLILKVLTQLKGEDGRLEAMDGSEFPLDAYLAGLGGKR